MSIDAFVDRLAGAADRIDRIHVVASDVLQITHDGTVGKQDLLYEALEDAVGADAVHVIDVYDEYTETLPNDDTQ